MLSGLLYVSFKGILIENVLLNIFLKAERLWCASIEWPAFVHLKESGFCRSNVAPSHTVTHTGQRPQTTPHLTQIFLLVPSPHLRVAVSQLCISSVIVFGKPCYCADRQPGRKKPRPLVSHPPPSVPMPLREMPSNLLLYFATAYQYTEEVRDI